MFETLDAEFGKIDILANVAGEGVTGRPEEVPIEDIEKALRSENVELPAGRLESLRRDFTVRMARGYRTAGDFANLVLARPIACSYTELGSSSHFPWIHGYKKR